MHSQDRVFATHIQKCMEIDTASYQKLELQPHGIYHHGYLKEAFVSKNLIVLPIYRQVELLEGCSRSSEGEQGSWYSV